jgi:hypothetical protein
VAILLSRLHEKGMLPFGILELNCLVVLLTLRSDGLSCTLESSGVGILYFSCLYICGIGLALRILVLLLNRAEDLTLACIKLLSITVGDIAFAMRGTHL